MGNILNQHYGWKGIKSLKKKINNKAKFVWCLEYETILPTNQTITEMKKKKMKRQFPFSLLFKLC